jgi:hypothetical protein
MVGWPLHSSLSDYWCIDAGPLAYFSQPKALFSKLRARKSHRHTPCTSPSATLAYFSIFPSSEVVILFIWTFVVITLASYKHSGILTWATGGYNKTYKGGSLVHRCHHRPSDFSPSPQCEQRFSCGFIACTGREHSWCINWKGIMRSTVEGKAKHQTRAGGLIHGAPFRGLSIPVWPRKSVGS